MRKLSELLQYHRNRWRDPADASHRLSQEEVSLKLGYAESTYGQWERGRGKPTDRRDLLQLIAILLTGSGVDSLDEANHLLREASFAELSPHEIRQLSPDWLPNWAVAHGDGDSHTNNDRHSAEDAVITHVYQRFPTEVFCGFLARGRVIRILNTWIPNLSNFIDLLIDALRNQASVQLLLLYPRSMVAELRNEALETSPKPVLRESVQKGIDDNLNVLQYISRHLDETQRKQLQVRFYHSLPSVSLYQVDQFCLMGLYFHGNLAINSPISEVNIHSFFGKRLEEEFNTLWSIGHPIRDWENWRLELDLLAGKF